MVTRDKKLLDTLFIIVIALLVLGYLMLCYRVEPSNASTKELSAYTKTGNYTVKYGDTLWKISQRLGITVDALRETNGLWNDLIYPGEIIYYEISNQLFNKEEIDLIARTVHAESRGEPFEGQVGVAAVILNRIKSPDFPNSVYGVIYQRWAFSSVDDGQIQLPAGTTAQRAVYTALGGYDPTYGSLFFWNPYLVRAGNWVWTLPIITQIGNHVFAK